MYDWIHTIFQIERYEFLPAFLAMRFDTPNSVNRQISKNRIQRIEHENIYNSILRVLSYLLTSLFIRSSFISIGY